MKYFYIFPLLMIVYSSCNSQNKYTKWEKSISSLECSGEVYSIQDQKNYVKSLHIENNPNIDLGKDSIYMRMIYDRVYSYGTGILVNDGKKQYIITAKHVLNDKIGSANMIKDAHYPPGHEVAFEISISTSLENALTNKKSILK